MNEDHTYYTMRVKKENLNILQSLKGYNGCTTINEVISLLLIQTDNKQDPVQERLNKELATLRKLDKEESKHKNGNMIKAKLKSFFTIPGEVKLKNGNIIKDIPGKSKIKGHTNPKPNKEKESNQGNQNV